MKINYSYNCENYSYFFFNYSYNMFSLFIHYLLLIER